jgi:hypothetical protein
MIVRMKRVLPSEQNERYQPQEDSNPARNLTRGALSVSAGTSQAAGAGRGPSAFARQTHLRRSAAKPAAGARFPLRQISPRHHRRFPRRPEHRQVRRQAQMGQDAAHNLRLVDEGQQAKPARTPGARQHIEPEAALHPPGPTWVDGRSPERDGPALTSPAATGAGTIAARPAARAANTP